MTQIDERFNVDEFLNGPAADDSATPHMLNERLKIFRSFLDDESLTEICVNRPGELWTEGRSGWRRHHLPDLTYSRLLQLAKLIAGYNRKKIDANFPVLSSALPTGERVQVVIPSACELNTVSVTIRKPSLVNKTLDELEAEGAFDEYRVTDSSLRPFEFELLALRKEQKIKEFLHKAVVNKCNILICGKTGSGKTTISKSLIRSIPEDERLITLEDVHELTLDIHKNKVHLFYSREDEGGSKVTAKQCLAACLRMKPDRILLAELRGDEAWEFIKSINTGHPGSISTMHANGAFEAFEQLTALIKDSRTGAHLDTEYIKHRLFTTLDVVLFYDNRKLKELYYDPEFKRKQLA